MKVVEYIINFLTVVSVSWLIGQIAYWFIYERKGRDDE